MAKGKNKGNREIRKPKSEKIKAPSSQTAPFAARAGLSAPKFGAKKGR